MADLYTRETAPLGQTPPRQIGDAGYYGRVRCVRATIDLDSQATADNILLGQRRVGERFAFGMLTTDTSLGTSQIAIGNSKTHASNTKYLADDTFTATDSPVLFGNVAAQDDAPPTQDEDIYLTLDTAALPSSGVLVIDMFFVGP